jgi:hypothetical protein
LTVTTLKSGIKGNFVAAKPPVNLQGVSFIMARFFGIDHPDLSLWAATGDRHGGT